MSVLEIVPKPLSYSSFIHAGICNCEWTSNGKHSIHLWEPIDTNASADARPMWSYGQVVFYDRTGNGLISRNVNVHDLTSIGDTHVLIGSGADAHWWSVCSASLVHRPEFGIRGWFIRWLCYDNTDKCRMLNAGWPVFKRSYSPAQNFPTREFFFKMIDLRRASMGISWRTLARIIGVSASTMTRFNQGAPIVDTVIFKLAAWYEEG